MIGISEMLMVLVIGAVIGVALMIISDSFNPNIVHKEKLINKQTIQMSNCYAQYSAVRRFPK